MKKIIIFDNGGQTLDRFTIVNKETGDIFGASENPYDSNGIGKFCGNCADHRIVLYGAGWRQKLPAKKIIQCEVENYVNNAKLNTEWIGPEVDIKSLPENVRDYISRLEVHNDSDQYLKANIAYLGRMPENLPLGAAGVH